MLSTTLRQLEYVCAIARHGGLTAAAAALHVSQPALSVALAQVEERLGQTLFYRRAGGPMTPTPYGRSWLAAAEVELDAMARLFSGTLRAAPLKLAIFADLAPLVLAPLLATQGEEVLSVQVLDFAALSAALRSGQADVALTWDLGLEPDIRRIVLAELPPQAVLAQDHVLAGRSGLGLADLAGHDLVLTDQGLSIDHMRALFARAGLRVRIGHRCATLELMRSYAANGLGIGLSYTQPAPRQSADGRPLAVVPVTDAGREAVVLALPARAGDHQFLPALQASLTALLRHDDQTRSKRLEDPACPLAKVL